MWEISPTLVRYDTTERTSPDLVLAGLQGLVAATATAKMSGAPFAKPISNFYQTDPISRAWVSIFVPCKRFQSDIICHSSVTMAQCTRAFVKDEKCGFSKSQSAPEAMYA